MEHYPAFICENGHPISTANATCSQKHCSECGARIISQCKHCQAMIEGHEYGVSGYYRVPKYCNGCGKPYPWVIAAVESTTRIVEESELDSVSQRRIIEILPDVISETPKTQLAAFRIQKAITSAGKFLADGLRQFVIDVGCELIKKQLDL